MFIQGDLQTVFDALYEVGAINPVLKQDWTEINNEMLRSPFLFRKAVLAVNSCKGDRTTMVEKFKALDGKILNFIAIEVAREFAEFQDCQILH